MDKTKYRKYKIVGICLLLSVSLLIGMLQQKKKNAVNAEIRFYELPQAENPEHNLTEEEIREGLPWLFSQEETEDGETLIDLNTACSEELQRITGIGPVLADRIVQYREEYGPFTVLDEVKEVYGIGDATYEKMKAWITLHSD